MYVAFCQDKFDLKNLLGVNKFYSKSGEFFIQKVNKDDKNYMQIYNEGYSLVYEYASIILKCEFADMCKLTKEEKIDLTKRMYIPSYEDKNEEECCIFIKDDSNNLRMVALPRKLQEFLKQIWKIEENMIVASNEERNLVSFNKEKVINFVIERYGIL